MAPEATPQLLIRADASTPMGTGHIMRCLALAQAWQDRGGQALLVAATLPQTLTDRLEAEGLGVRSLGVQPGSYEDAAQSIAMARGLGSAWIMVDGYQFGADYQRALKDAGLRVLFVDDYGHAGSYCADLVLNQNSSALTDWYTKREPNTRLLLGPSYILLRREFWSWRGRRREITPVARRVLITLGGADPDNVTSKVIEALNLLHTSQLEAVVVAGASNPYYAQLQQAAARSRHQIRVERNVGTMPELMAWADLAITAGGTTCYELALMGLPALLIVLAENQAPGATALTAAGATYNIGWHEDLALPTLAEALGEIGANMARRASMSAAGQTLVDGYGAARVVAKLCGEPLRLRRATPDDCRLLWEWVNEPAIRAASFNSEPIGWESHVLWFESQLANPGRLIFIAVDPGSRPVGQIRFAIQGKTAVVSISLGAEARGLGYGPVLIRLGTAAAFAAADISRVDAFVKVENEASLRAFERAGFSRIEAVSEPGALRLSFHREGTQHE